MTMAKEEDATKAQAALDGKKVGDGEHEREMRVTFAKKRSDEDQAKADQAKEAASQRRAERAKKQKDGGDAPEGEAPAPQEAKPKKAAKKKNNKKKGGKGGGNSTEATGEGTGDVSFNKKRTDQSSAQIKQATKGGFAAPKGKAVPKKELTDEEKKARGLLYDTSKAKAVRDDDDDEDDEGEADFAGGDPFAGL